MGQWDKCPNNFSTNLKYFFQRLLRQLRYFKDLCIIWLWSQIFRTVLIIKKNFQEMKQPENYQNWQNRRDGQNYRIAKSDKSFKIDNLSLILIFIIIYAYKNNKLHMYFKVFCVFRDFWRFLHNCFCSFRLPEKNPILLYRTLAWI